MPQSALSYSTPLLIAVVSCNLGYFAFLSSLLSSPFLPFPFPPSPEDGLLFKAKPVNACLAQRRKERRGEKREWAREVSIRL